MSKSIEKYAYLNTHSEAGRPDKIVFNSDNVKWANVWVNSYGNPTYMLYLEDGTTLLCVDDYGAMNGINHISARTVPRRKDL